MEQYQARIAGGRVPWMMAFGSERHQLERVRHHGKQRSRRGSDGVGLGLYVGDLGRGLEDRVEQHGLADADRAHERDAQRRAIELLLDGARDLDRHALVAAAAAAVDPAANVAGGGRLVVVVVMVVVAAGVGVVVASAALGGRARDHGVVVARRHRSGRRRWMRGLARELALQRVPHARLDLCW